VKKVIDILVINKMLSGKKEAKFVDNHYLLEVCGAPFRDSEQPIREQNV
jgi:hypothetical protein